MSSNTQHLKEQGFDVVFDKKIDFDLMHIHVPTGNTMI